MKRTDLHFEYPDELIALEKRRPSRVLWFENGQSREISPHAALGALAPDDILVINDTKVIKARVFTKEGLEILFVSPISEKRWKVLCPARRWPKIRNSPCREGWVSGSLKEGCRSRWSFRAH